MDYASNFKTKVSWASNLFLTNETMITFYAKENVILPRYKLTRIIANRAPLGSTRSANLNTIDCRSA